MWKRGVHLNNFDKEIREGFKILRQRKIKELNLYENELMEMRKQIGEILAEKELYKYRKNCKDHKGLESKIRVLDYQANELIKAYSKKSEEFNIKKTRLQFDIENLNELIED